MQKHAILHKSFLLIIISKNYISHQTILKKSAETVVFVRKVSQGSSFKKDNQLNSHFSMCMWCCGCTASQTFLSYLSNYHYSQRLNSISPVSYAKKKKFKSFFFGAICKFRLYSLEISTYIPILDFLLVHIY